MQKSLLLLYKGRYEDQEVTPLVMMYYGEKTSPKEILDEFWTTFENSLEGITIAVCEKCNEKFQDWHNFCSKCGNKLNESTKTRSKEMVMERLNTELFSAGGCVDISIEEALNNKGFELFPRSFSCDNVIKIPGVEQDYVTDKWIESLGAVFPCSR